MDFDTIAFLIGLLLWLVYLIVRFDMYPRGLQ